MRASPDDVTVVTVAANSGEALLAWRDRWRASGCRLLVADNGSSDGVPERSGVSVLPTGGNRGYGPGVNAGVQACTTPLVLITNPDILPEHPDSVTSLFALHRPGTLSGALMADSRGRVLPSGGNWPTVPWVAEQVIFPARTLWKGTSAQWIQGGLILVERDLFLEDLGGFCEEYPLYFEDVDLCARARDRGIPVELHTEARFLHREGTGAPALQDVRIACFHWGLWRWFARHRPASSDRVHALLRAKCLFRLGLFRRSPSRRGYARTLAFLKTGIPPELPPL